MEAPGDAVYGGMLVEATPQNIRLRKRILDANARKLASKGPNAEDHSGR